MASILLAILAIAAYFLIKDVPPPPTIEGEMEPSEFEEETAQT